MQIWPCSTEWSRAKANRALPGEHTGHSKHPLPTTQEKTLHMDITTWSTQKSDWLYSLQPKMEKLYTVSKNKTGGWLAERNINNLRYTDDTTLMAKSEEELKSLLLKVKEESEKVGLKLNIQKMKIMASGPITSWEIDGETVETMSDFIFLGSKITADGDCSHEIKRHLFLGAGFRKGRGTRDQIANIRWVMEKAREFQKSIYFCFIDYAKAFDWMDHNKLWKILKELGIPDHMICLLRNLYVGQEATVRTGHGITDWFQIGKGVHQGCILSSCLFNFYAEYIMRNAGLEETQDCQEKYQ